MRGLKGAEVGCIKSHINVLTNTDSELILVLEDDFELVDDFDSKLMKCLAELPDDWQGLWLGGRTVKPRENYSEHLQKIQATTGAFGYIVRKSFVPDLVAELEKFTLLADWAMSKVFKRVYRSKRNLVKHKNGYSYIQNKDVRYADLSHE